MSAGTSHLFPTSLMHEAADLVDSSGIAENIAKWMKEDQKHRGGRATSLTTRAALIAWVATALEKSPLHMTRVAELLCIRLSPETADILGVPYEFAQVEHRDMFQRLDRATNRFMEVLDFKPLPDRRTRMLKSEWDAYKRERDARHEELEVKRQRMFRVSNDLMHAQFLSLPETVHSNKVSLSVDATFLSAFSRGMSNKNLAARPAHKKYVAEPDATLYLRTYENPDGMKGVKKRGFGWEYELVALISNDARQPRAVPHIAIGFNQHPASTLSNPRAREIFDDIIERGLQIDHVVGDGAYFPGAVADMLQNPLRKHGAKLVMKYAVSQEDREANGEGTIQGTNHGGIQVEGRWYCPAMSALLRNAQVDFRNEVAALHADTDLSSDEKKTREAELRATRDARILERRRWELRRKEKPDERGMYPMMCPAVGPNRTLSCPLKGEQTSKVPDGIVPLPVLHPPKAPGKICTNQSSVKFHIDDDGKYGQHYRYLSPEWQRMHTYGRQVIEGFNYAIKHADNVLHDSGTRRKKGEPAQAFLATLAVVATNSSRIHKWMDEHYDEQTPAPQATDRMSRTPRPQGPTLPQRRSKKGVSAARLAQLGLPQRA